MIYFFYGNDRARGRQAAKTLFDSLRTKKPEAAFLYLDEESFTPLALNELIESQGLFEKKCVVLLSEISLAEGGESYLLEKGQVLATSPNIFIFFEESPGKELSKLFLKIAEKSKEFEKKETAKTPKFNLFNLCDALAGRNRKNLWLCYREAINNGTSPEEINSMLFWQVKNLLLVKLHQGLPENGPAETGLKLYPYQKAKKAAEFWKKEELTSFIYSLAEAHQKARSGEEDFEISLEKLLISV